MRIVGLDPGNVYTAWVVLDGGPPTPAFGGIMENGMLLEFLRRGVVPYDDPACSNLWDAHVAIEMIASYGMPVGKSVFDTALWVGRFFEAIEYSGYGLVDLVYRKDVKLHLCQSMRANDATIRAAIIDLYGDDKRSAVGLKSSPGPLYGFKRDMWAALGVALTHQHNLNGEENGIQ